MKKLYLCFLAAAFACNNQKGTDTTIKGNTDTTIDSIIIKQDSSANKDTGMIDTRDRGDSIRK